MPAFLQHRELPTACQVLGEDEGTPSWMEDEQETCSWAGELCPAKGRLHIYNIIRGPGNMISLKLSLLCWLRLIR